MIGIAQVFLFQAQRFDILLVFALMKLSGSLSGDISSGKKTDDKAESFRDYSVEEGQDGEKERRQN